MFEFQENTTIFNKKFVDIYDATNTLVVAEVGFGFGLNFFTLLSSFPEQKFHYIACEKSPFSAQKLREIYARFGCFGELFDEFVEKYYVLDGNMIRVNLKNAILDLYFLETKRFLDECDFEADVWFLESSNLSNDANLQKDVLKSVSEHSKKGSFLRVFCGENFGESFGEICGKSELESELANFGFFIEKFDEFFDEFSKKRKFFNAICLAPAPKNRREIWFSPPVTRPFKRVLVVGAGVAGLVAAVKFREAGFEVVVTEAKDAVATNGSSNVAGILMPLVCKKGVKLGDWHMSAFLRAVSFYRNFSFCGINLFEFCKFCGVEVVLDELEKSRFESFGENEIFSIFGERAQIFCGAQIRPKALCEALASVLDVRTGMRLVSLKRTKKEKNGGGESGEQNGSDGFGEKFEFVENGGENGEQNGGEDEIWEATFANGEKLCAGLVVLATGSESGALFEGRLGGEFADSTVLQSAVRGAVLHAGFDVSGRAHPVSGKAYVCAFEEGVSVVGATFERFNGSREFCEKDKKRILFEAEGVLNSAVLARLWEAEFCAGFKNDKQIGKKFIKFYEIKNLQICKCVKCHKNSLNLTKNEFKVAGEFAGRKCEIFGANVAFRSYTSDRFSLVGGVHDGARFCQIYKKLFWTKRKACGEVPAHFENLLVSSAHGSRGFGSAVLAADILVDIALNRPVGCLKSVLNEVNPARFLVRKLKKTEKFVENVRS